MLSVNLIKLAQQTRAACCVVLAFRVHTKIILRSSFSLNNATTSDFKKLLVILA